ncbi:hypothetical protein [Acetivibrio ethanolgignens]|uniref:Uncharacterized protein n=1 Tax=Acetivibrio ethanolgignens TaxID=290052 RepID=A0A0V8QDU9_9FIRM|nr:hypothetical protein [Acetivibrio ethanolgignens]KSV58752.1 hypothetical protein ASU35_11860 [Acetivibrio ethanolgignens]
MPTREVLTEEIVVKCKNFLKDVLHDFYELPCCASLSYLLIILYEVAIVVYSYKYSERKTATYTCVKSKLPKTEGHTTFVTLRDNLTHNFYTIENLYKYVLTSMQYFSKENFDAIVRECFDSDIDLYQQIINYCKIKILAREATTKYLDTFSRKVVK